mmetsp:Transcript_26736/g.48208  ORF Transcript_26736/g.48208 Transcript_26736/m.48208 type:complete len:671 (+) Transcript_26736:184-2196(+)
MQARRRISFHNTLSNEIADLKQGNVELQKRYEQVCSERDYLTRNEEKLASALAELESSKGEKLKELSSMMDSERLKHANAMETLQNDILGTTMERDALTRRAEGLASALAALQSSQDAKDVLSKDTKKTLEEERIVHNNALRTLQNDIHDISMERDSVTRRAENLASTLAGLESSQDTKDATIKELKSTLEKERLVHSNSMENLQGDIDRMTMEKEALTQQIDDLASTIAEVKSSNETGIQNMESTMEAERIMHANTVAELQSVFDLELEKQRSRSKAQVEKIDILANQLREEVHKLFEIKSEQERQIIKLKDSLRDALEEALRLGSKITSEQAKLVELTCTMSSFEEENVQLKQSLQSSRSEVGGISLSSREMDHSHLKLSLRKIIEEKQRLEGELSAKETKLFETMNTLTNFELKLTKAEQERDGQYAEITHLHNDLRSLEKTQQVKEKDLIDQIVALKKDCEVDDLYRELLDKTKDKEMHYNSIVRSMKKDVDSLKEEIESLAEDKDRLTLDNANIVADNESLAEEEKRLTLVNDYILVENSSLAENVASLESKLAKKDNDESSSTSGASRASNLKRAAVELETTVRAIKKHHSETVKKLQGELDDTHKRLKKYERKVKDLAQLLEENSFIIESLHKKLKGKKQTRNSNSLVAPPRPTHSEGSMVTD